MTTTAIKPNPPAAVATGKRPWRLGARHRKAYLLLHIVSGGGWIGIDVVMGVLVFTAIFSDDTGTKAMTFRALELFASGRSSSPASSAWSAASCSAWARSTA